MCSPAAFNTVDQSADDGFPPPLRLPGETMAQSSARLMAWAQRQEAGPAVAERDPMVRTAVWLVVASATVICVLVAAL